MQISLKVGASKILKPPTHSTEGFAYKTISPFWVYPSLHVEAKKPDFFGEGKSFLSGISFIPTFNDLSINEKNFQSGSGRSLRATAYSFQFYFGVEKSLQSFKAPKYKNFFSLIAGLGLNLSGGNMHDAIYFGDYGITKQGELFEGTYYTIERGRYLSPILLTGIKYNITNASGKVVVSIELMANYNLSQYFSHTLRYKIDGTNRVDYLREKGFQILLNINIPVFNLKKNK